MASAASDCGAVSHCLYCFGTRPANGQEGLNGRRCGAVGVGDGGQTQPRESRQPCHSLVGNGPSRQQTARRVDHRTNGASRGVAGWGDLQFDLFLLSRAVARGVIVHVFDTVQVKRPIWSVPFQKFWQLFRGDGPMGVHGVDVEVSPALRLKLSKSGSIHGR